MNRCQQSLLWVLLLSLNLSGIMAAGKTQHRRIYSPSAPDKDNTLEVHYEPTVDTTYVSSVQLVFVTQKTKHPGLITDDRVLINFQAQYKGIKPQWPQKLQMVIGEFTTGQVQKIKNISIRMKKQNMVIPVKQITPIGRGGGTGHMVMAEIPIQSFIALSKANELMIYFDQQKRSFLIPNRYMSVLRKTVKVLSPDQIKT